MHNALHSANLTPSGCGAEERLAVCAGAAVHLRGKLKALRRLRLPLLYQEWRWAFWQGALSHLIITIPFWIR